MQFCDVAYRLTQNLLTCRSSGARSDLSEGAGFLPEGVRQSSAVTDDFCGVTLVYELKMTAKFAVKIG